MPDLAWFLSWTLFAIGIAVILVQDFHYLAKLALAVLLGLALAGFGRLAARRGWWAQHD